MNTLSISQGERDHTPLRRDSRRGIEVSLGDVVLEVAASFRNLWQFRIQTLNRVCGRHEVRAFSGPRESFYFSCPRRKARLKSSRIAAQRAAINPSGDQS